MYGTIARVKIDPTKLEELIALNRRIATAPGQLARYIYQMDADPGEVFLVAVFESKEAYWANANSPEQHQRFQEFRALMLADPEWHDGEIVDVAS
jgi:quinol monooxygenase YgiN